MPKAALHIAEKLDLPIDFVTKTAAILAQRRKGKTYTASVVAEELVAASMPFAALDPTGAWWGLRSSADGKSEGLPVVILGGEHGDLPLERQSGRLVADLVLEHPGYYVLDLSLLDSKNAEREFATAFAERLYRRKMQPGMDFPLHLFVDEADMFVPQDKDRGDTTMLGAFQSIVRRGGLHGLGTTLISQRPALVNKSVLTQLDILILLRLIAGNDQDYVDKNYISRAGSKPDRDELMGSMASLALGEAWIWEPGAEPPLFVRAQIRERHTFNSSATPKAGERRVEPTRLAAVDLAAIKEQMAETIERAKADDPKELRRRIAQLERQLVDVEKSRPAPEVRVEHIEVPVLDEQLVVRLEEALSPAVGLMSEVQERLRWETTQTDQAITFERKLTERAPTKSNIGGRSSTTNVAMRDRSRRPQPARKDSGQDPRPVGNTELGKGERIILSAVAQYDAGVTKEQLTVLTGYKRSSRDTYLQRLRQAGYAEQSGSLIVATAAGVEALGDDYEPLPTGAELRAYWLDRLSGGEREILAALIDAYPVGVHRDDLSEQTGYKRSSRDTYLQRLRARQLVTTDGDPRASDDLF